MSKENLKIKFDNPPVHVTASGSLSIAADDIFHSKAGQDIILRMATLPPLTPDKKEIAKEDPGT